MSDERPVNLKRNLQRRNRDNGIASVEKSSIRKCIVHYNRNCADSDERPITEQSFQTIRKVVDVCLAQNNVVHRLSDICSTVPLILDSELHGAHRWCYSFTNTAHIKAVIVSKELSSSTVRTSKRNSSVKALASSGSVGSSSKCSLFPPASILFPRTCLFCDEINKFWNGKLQTLRKCQTKTAEMTIKRSAQQKAEYNVLRKVDGVDLVAKEAWYHECCRQQIKIRISSALVTTGLTNGA
jgi:hypothetical protein